MPAFLDETHPKSSRKWRKWSLLSVVVISCVSCVCSESLCRSRRPARVTGCRSLSQHWNTMFAIDSDIYHSTYSTPTVVAYRHRPQSMPNTLPGGTTKTCILRGGRAIISVAFKFFAPPRILRGHELLKIERTGITTKHGPFFLNKN